MSVLNDVVWNEMDVGLLADKLGVDLEAGRVGPPDRVATRSATTPSPMVSVDLLEREPIVKALYRLDMIQGGPRMIPEMGVGYDIICPWVEGHSQRADSGTVYAPLIRAINCFHGSCQDRMNKTPPRERGALIAEKVTALLREDSGGLVGLGYLDFDVVDETTVRLVTGGGSSSASWVNAPWNPFVVPAPPDWPGDILPVAFEDTLRAIARRDGMDFPALATAFVVAASGMADKRARFQPLPHTGWVVPPILWAAFIADSGQLKSGMLDHALRPLHHAHAVRMRDFLARVARWKARPPANKADPRPDDPPQLLVQDTTVEKLQMIIEDNQRGPIYLRDELAGLFDFGRYTGGAGTNERTFFLESYEGKSFTVNRVGRPMVYIDNCALTIMGGIQAEKLATFGDLTTDGLLQRFGTVRLNPNTPVGVEGTTVTGLDQLEAAMTRMLTMHPVATYHTDDGGYALIAKTRGVGHALSRIPDFGKGFTGFAGKLHGTMARAALVLHLLDAPTVDLIPAATVKRAERFTVFLLEHAQQFYSALPGSAEHMAKAVASYVLRKGMTHLVASDLTSNVAACRGMTLKELNGAVSRLVAEDWLRPQQNGPDNRRWNVRPGLQKTFPDALQAETLRVDKVKTDMNWHGQYR